jgi:hypothetical protein
MSKTGMLKLAQAVADPASKRGDAMTRRLVARSTLVVEESSAPLQLIYTGSEARFEAGGELGGVIHEFTDARSGREFAYVEFAHQPGGWSFARGGVLHVLRATARPEPYDAALAGVSPQWRLASLSHLNGGSA